MFSVVAASRWHQDADWNWSRVVLRSTQATGAMMSLFCDASRRVLSHELGLSPNDPQREAILRSLAVIFNNACRDRDMQQRLLIVQDAGGSATHLRYEHAAGSLAAKCYKRPTKRQKGSDHLPARSSRAFY